MSSEPNIHANADESATPSAVAPPDPSSDPADPQPNAPAADAEAEPVIISPGQLEELQQKAAKADENWDRLLRAAAELDNYKKRALRERQDAIRYANEALLEKLIPVLDNFEMALQAAAAPSAASIESLKTGVEMIYSQLRNAMKDAGLEEIDARSQKFDPACHEAVAQQESAEVSEGHVLQQLRKGYKLRDRLLRPATVVVAKKTGA